jgi:hypothetical protein
MTHVIIENLCNIMKKGYTPSLELACTLHCVFNLYEPLRMQ